MTKSQIQDLINFIEAATVVKYDPPCAITTMMVTDGIDLLSDEELVKEAVELSRWLIESAKEETMSN